MKRIIVILLIIGLAINSFGQSTLDIYKTGVLKLVPEYGYSEGVNWEEVFPDFNLVASGNPIGRYKSMAISSDGSVFVSNYSSYSIQKFDANGKPLFSFGTKGNREQDFLKRPTLGGVVGEKYVFTHEHNGHIKLFTLDGRYAKTITLDYMPIKGIALTSNRIAIIGHVPRGEAGVRYVVTVINPETGEQKIIKKFDNLWNNNKLMIKRDNYVYSYSPLSSQAQVVIRPHPSGGILVGTTNSSQLELHSSDGLIEKKFNLDFKAIPYPEDLKKQFISMLEGMVEKGQLKKDDIASVYKDDFFIKTMPYYYNLLVDGDGNILVFKYIDKDIDHFFRVLSFTDEGKVIGDAILDVIDYKLVLNYRFDELAFSKNNVIGLVQPANGNREAVRLVRFEMRGK
jgi:hypothetical protein